MSYFFRGAYYQVSTKQKKFLYVSSYFLIALEALVNAFSYEIFIFPNNFAPAGVAVFRPFCNTSPGFSAKR